MDCQGAQRQKEGQEDQWGGAARVSPRVSLPGPLGLPALGFLEISIDNKLCLCCSLQPRAVAQTTSRIITKQRKSPWIHAQETRPYYKQGRTTVFVVPSEFLICVFCFSLVLLSQELLLGLR